MEQSWLNPDYAIQNIVTLVSMIVLLLIVVPAVFGLLFYGVLTLIARWQDMQRMTRPDVDSSDE